MQYRLGRLSKDCQGLKSSSANSRLLLPAKGQGEELRKAHKRCARILGNVICRVSFLAGLSRNRGYRVTKRLTQACRRKTKGINRAEKQQKATGKGEDLQKRSTFLIFKLLRSKSREARLDVGCRSSRSWTTLDAQRCCSSGTSATMRNSLEHVSKPEGSHPLAGRQEVALS
jgi:hypothetical protein